MFAYCLNNPVCRRDVGGATSQECYNSEDVDFTDNDKDIAGGNVGNSGPGGNSGGNGHSGSSGNGGAGKVSSNSVAMDPGDALDSAIDILGSGYVEAYPSGSGRFISADGLRQVRIGYDDLLGLHAGAPHINFEFIGCNGSFHVYLVCR